jgi:hypothetical protein
VTEMIVPMGSGEIDAQQLAEQLVARAKAEGLELPGPGGLLTGLAYDHRLRLLPCRWSSWRPEWRASWWWPRPEHQAAGGNWPAVTSC